jgi:nicotinamidase-related amidase
MKERFFKMKFLVVVDMQNDFITGALGSPLTRAIVPNAVEKVKQAIENGDAIIFTRDTHELDYLNTPEGIKLPIEHCIKGTMGWEVIPELMNLFVDEYYTKVQFIDKPIFGSVSLLKLFSDNDEIEYVGVCTDICLVSNVLMAKSFYPGAKISVDASCCAGTSLDNHLSALDVMRSCQIDIIGEEK